MANNFRQITNRRDDSADVIKAKPSGPGPTAGVIFFGRKENEAKETLFISVAGWRRFVVAVAGAELPVAAEGTKGDRPH